MYFAKQKCKRKPYKLNELSAFSRCNLNYLQIAVFLSLTSHRLLQVSGAILNILCTLSVMWLLLP